MSAFAAQILLVLRNDLRLWWRELRGRKLQLAGSGALIGLVLLVAHAIAIPLCANATQAPPLFVEAGLWLFFGILMLGFAIQRAISLLFERGDFDLLLASPVSPRAVLLARLGAIAITTALSAGVFLVPLLNGALIGFSARYAAGYAVWSLLAFLAATGGIGLSLLLVRCLGARRARVVVQVLGALLGASVYLGTQLPRLLPDPVQAQVQHALGLVLRHPVAVGVAEAGRGQPGALAYLALAVVVAAAVTARWMARTFVRGTLDTMVSHASGRRRSGATRDRWREGIAAATFYKDLRLIVRDPLLLAQVLPSAFVMVSLLAGAAHRGGMVMLAPASVFVAAQFSMVLARVATAGEECWDLIRMSPSSERRLRLAKMAAGMVLPVAVTAALCGAVAALGRPGLALIAFVTATGVAAGCARLAVSEITPTPRHDLLKSRRSGGSLAHNILAAVLVLPAAGGVGLAAFGQWLIGAGLLGGVALGVVACFALVEFKELQFHET